MMRPRDVQNSMLILIPGILKLLQTWLWLLPICYAFPQPDLSTGTMWKLRFVGAIGACQNSYSTWCFVPLESPGRRSLERSSDVGVRTPRTGGSGGRSRWQNRLRSKVILQLRYPIASVKKDGWFSPGNMASTTIHCPQPVIKMQT